MSERTGAGDPARTLELLWRQPGPSARRGRGPKPGLEVDRVVAAAVETADRDGLQALSMRRIARRLGVTAMTLYTYVPGKAELVDLMTDAVYGELEYDGHPPGGWRTRLESVARRNRDLHRRHPWLCHVVTGRPPLGPHLMAKYEHELGALDGVGLTDVEMDAVLTLVLDFVSSSARSTQEAARTAAQTGADDAQWWAANEPLLGRFLDPGRYPLAARVGSAAGNAHGAAYDPEHAFEFGLQRVLDGISVLIDQ